MTIDNEEIKKVVGRITTGLTEASERILSLAGTLKDAKEISKEQLMELGDITKLMSELTQRYPSPKSTAQKGAEAEESFVPKAIQERVDAIASRLADAMKTAGAPVAQAAQEGANDPKAEADLKEKAAADVAAAAAAKEKAAADVAAAARAEVDWPPDMAAESATSEKQAVAPAAVKT